MDAKEVIRILMDDGWYFVRQEGSHCVFKHPTKKGLIVVPYHGHKDIAVGTLKQILKAAGIK